MKEWIKKWYNVVGITLTLIILVLYCVLYCIWGEGTNFEKLTRTLFIVVGTLLITNDSFMISMIKARREKKLLLKEINNKIKLSINHINCSSYGFGLIKKRSHIKKCDIYITDDALIIFANKARPIILTQYMSYHFKFKYIEIFSVCDITFNQTNSYVTIQLDFSKYSKTITLKTLTDTEKKALQNFAQSNGFTIIHHK